MVLAFAYALSGYLGLLLAGPSGRVTPIFPASGIAVGFILVYGVRYLPGVFFGSFLMNLALSMLSGQEILSGKGLSIAFLIASGATFQTFLGHFFGKNYLHRDKPLVKSIDVILFLLIVGPASCMSNAIWGSMSLYTTGLIRANEIFQSFLNWWLGDTLGALAFVPIFLAFFSTHSDLWKKRRLLLVIPISILLGIIILFFWQSQRNESLGIKREFLERLNLFKEEIENQGQIVSHSLYSIRSLFYASQSVEREEFDRFTIEALGARRENSFLSWIPKVERSERIDFDRKMMSELDSSYYIYHLDESKLKTKVKEKDFYLPINFIIPFYKYQSLIGLDLEGTFWLDQTSEEEKINGRIFFSTDVKLQTKEGSLQGEFFVLPVYRKNVNVGKSGYIVLFLEKGKFITNAISHINDINLIDVEIIEFNSGKTYFHQTTGEKNAKDIKSEEFKIKIFNKDWLVRANVSELFAQKYLTSIDWFNFTLVIILTYLLSVFLLIVSGQEYIISHKFNEKIFSLKDKISILHRSRYFGGHFIEKLGREIRTPLDIIFGMTSTMKGGHLDQQTEEKINVIHKNGTNILKVINDALMYFELDSPLLKISKIPVNLVRILDKVIEFYHEEAREKNISIEFNLLCEEGELRDVLSDENRISQIFHNLIGNAVKYNQDGWVRISLSMRNTGSSIVEASFVVEDTGVGIPKDKLKDIFRPFIKVDEKNAHVVGGTGLGLAITKSLVHLLEGTIEVESELEKGSRFTLVFEFEESIIDIEVDDVYKENYQLVDDYPMEILVVDDNQFCRKVMDNYLTKMGYQVDFAENGRVAVEKVLAKVYDVVFMDCHMPVMDGFDASKAILESNLVQRPIIVAVTADVSHRERDYCEKCGMSDFIPKPVEVESIQKVIKKWFKDKKIPA